MGATLRWPVRAGALLAVASLVGLYATVAVSGGTGWAHQRFLERTSGEQVVIDIWTRGPDVTLAVSTNAEVTEVRSCRDGVLVESFQDWRVERIGYGKDCARWAGERLTAFRAAASAIPAGNRQDLGGGITRYTRSDGSWFDLDPDGFPVAARHADGTATSWERLTGGPEEPPVDLPSSAWERYRRLDRATIAPLVGLREVPLVVADLTLEDCVVYSTSDGVVSAHVSWRGGDQVVELVVTSAGVPLAEVEAGLVRGRDGASMTLVDGPDIVQVHGPDAATVLRATAELQTDWVRALEKAGE